MCVFETELDNGENIKTEQNKKMCIPFLYVNVCIGKCGWELRDFLQPFWCLHIITYSRYITQ